MKTSNYNFIWPLENQEKSILFNSLTTSLLEINNRHIHLLNETKITERMLASKNRQVIDSLKKGGFILEKETDELKILEFLFNSQKYDQSILALTIAPTLHCNFACPYCYEQEVLNEKVEFMSEDIQKKLVDLVKQYTNKINRMVITWYGGEPLLASDIIFSLSEKFKSISDEHNISYSALMITNGYLFEKTSAGAEKLKKSNINEFQITVDGPPEIHNQRRKLKSSDEATFDVILQNIQWLKKNGFKPSIRINVDNKNKDEALQLLNIFESNNLIDLPIHLGYVQPDTDGCQQIKQTCTAPSEFSKLQQSFYSILYNKRSNANIKPRYPRFAKPCLANNIGSIIVDPDGDIYKCRADIGDKKTIIGNITHPEKRTNVERMREIAWLTWDPFNRESCKQCKYLPICMGGCSHRVMSYNKLDCSDWKYSLKHYIHERYIRSQQTVKEATK